MDYSVEFFCVKKGGEKMNSLFDAMIDMMDGFIDAIFKVEL